MGGDSSIVTFSLLREPMTKPKTVQSPFHPTGSERVEVRAHDGPGFLRPFLRKVFPDRCQSLGSGCFDLGAQVCFTVPKSER
jgi:hypothetical protein